MTMSKLSTITMVALTGATLGAGSTFGWWQEADPTPTVEVEVEVNSEAEIERTSGSRIGKTPHAGQPPEVVKKFIHFNPGPHAAIEKLIHELEQEVEALEKQGQKEKAAQQRGMLERLRGAIKHHSGPGANALFRHEEPAHKHARPELKFNDHNSIEAEIRESAEHLEALHHKLAKVEDDATQQRLKGEIAVATAHLQHLKQRAEHQQVRGAGPGHGMPPHGHPGPGPQMTEQMRRMAEKMEQHGQLDAARRVREQLLKLNQQMERGVHQGMPQPTVIIIENGKVTTHAGGPLPTPSERIHSQIHAEHLDGHHGHVPGKMHPAGQEKIHEVLVDLRHEIKQLRAEVQELRHHLKFDRSRKSSAHGPSKKFNPDQATKETERHDLPQKRKVRSEESEEDDDAPKSKSKADHEAEDEDDVRSTPKSVKEDEQQSDDDEPAQKGREDRPGKEEPREEESDEDDSDQAEEREVPESALKDARDKEEERSSPTDEADSERPQTEENDSTARGED